MSLKDSEDLILRCLFHLCAEPFRFEENKNPSPPKLPISFATDNVHEMYLTIAGNDMESFPMDCRLETWL